MLWSKTKDYVKGEETLKAGAFAKLAIATPTAAPYGAAAIDTLKALKLYEALEPKIVQGNNIAQTFQFIDTGNAELGFVALSQLAGEPAGSRWVVPQTLYTPIRQDAVLLKKGAGNEAAAAFLPFSRDRRRAPSLRNSGMGSRVELTGHERPAVAALVAMPLVLPPTVLGFYLLLMLGPYGPGGLIAGLWGARTLAFTFEGLVIGSVFYSMPFVVQPIRNAFAAIGDRPLEVAATLRASPRRVFWTVALPMARPGFLTGAVLGFAHTVGEFGVVLMIGGNIPGETKVLSVAIYDYVETSQWREANILAAGMVAFAFAVILSIALIERRVARTGA